MYITISEAARLAQISRTAFYKTYINKGKISTSTNEQGARCIELSELLRVFPSLRVDNGEVTGVETEKNNSATSIDYENLVKLRVENEFLRQQVKDLKEYEEWQREKIDSLLDAVKLLEVPKTAPLLAVTRQWWQFWK